MMMLWPLGEGTVREIRDELAAVRPRAYTTIMTIMDRLARKGVVTRRKVGRAYLYRPSFTADEARARAVEQLLRHFFAGSQGALIRFLNGEAADGAEPARPAARWTATPDRLSVTEESAPADVAGGIDETLL